MNFVSINGEKPCRCGAFSLEVRPLKTICVDGRTISKKCRELRGAEKLDILKFADLAGVTFTNWGAGYNGKSEKSFASEWGIKN